MPPDAPTVQQPAEDLRSRPPRDLNELTAPRPVIINGRPYTAPTQRQLFFDYLNDAVGPPAFARITARAIYNHAMDIPNAWDQDATGFGQRFGSNVGVSAINGTVRYGMEEVFHEDLRYIACHGCSFKHKVENALMAEISARHDRDGHRFFTVTPTIADFSGPLIARQLWYPTSNNTFWSGIVASRTVFATRIGGHLFREFIWERRHSDKPEQR